MAIADFENLFASAAFPVAGALCLVEVLAVISVCKSSGTLVSVAAPAARGAERTI